MRFTSEQRLDDGFLERDFALGGIPGVLWTSGAAPAPLILCGHNGGLHKRLPRLAAQSGIWIEPSAASGMPGFCAISQTWPSRSAKQPAKSAIERLGRRPGDRGSRTLGGSHDNIDLGLGADVVVQDNTTEPCRLVVSDAAVQRELVTLQRTTPIPPAWMEYGLLDLLAFPAQPLIEHPSAVHVGDTQRDETDPLFHRPKLPLRAWRTLQRAIPLDSTGWYGYPIIAARLPGGSDRCRPARCGPASG